MIPLSFRRAVASSLPHPLAPFPPLRYLPPRARPISSPREPHPRSPAPSLRPLLRADLPPPDRPRPLPGPAHRPRHPRLQPHLRLGPHAHPSCLPAPHHLDDGPRVLRPQSLQLGLPHG